MNNSAKQRRNELISRLFPQGIPQLWCPPLTHFTDEGGIDFGRMTAHLEHMSRQIKGYLVPGSTSEGWEMSEEEVHRVLAFSLDMAQKFNLQILIGILRTNAEASYQAIIRMLTWLKERAGVQNNEKTLEITRVCGFVVCPPKGNDLPQAKIYQAFESILDLGVPVALYQLPQITENEVSPETVAKLAIEFSNFYLFKDSSGDDRVAMSGLELNGVYLVRGEEGDYDKWLRINNGSYDGFLLGSANCFAKEFNSIIQSLLSGNLNTARELSEKITGIVEQVSDYATNLPTGNPFAITNKAIDHFFAYGRGAIDMKPPRMHSGARLSAKIMKITGEALTHYDLMPSNGYLSAK